MRRVTYRRWEYRHGASSWRDANLVTFIYDVPYLGVWGILPPLPMLNEILQLGGGNGGMSPGAEWYPFTLSQSEYEELVEVLEKTEPSSLDARYTFIKLKRAPEFDHISDHREWGQSVTQKFQSSALKEQEESVNRYGQDT